ncbi:MAG: SDR family NAD(P)-dependent oxidoreductase [Solirubrobacteraceae bacterium]|nr:SDR family NAD(P)-dependent oxidoreductase [Solirubrobacteraceae bacterium]
MGTTGSLLEGRRVLITGAARGIGAALAVRLHERGARVALLGLEPELLAATAVRAGGAPWRECDIADGAAVTAAVEALVQDLGGGLDVVVANAGIAKQMPMLGGDPAVLERTLQVNVMGTFHTLRAAGPHIAHEGGYAIAIASAAAALHLPLLGAYNASKSATEALGNTLRAELRRTGAKVGVAYFGELDTDMTRRGFDTEASHAVHLDSYFTRVAPLEVGIDALERGIARRSRRVYAPRWVGPMLPARMLVQPLIDRISQRGLQKALAIAREEEVEFTTPQPVEPTTRAA